ARRSRLKLGEGFLEAGVAATRVFKERVFRMKIVLATTCRSRRAHIEQTLPLNLGWLGREASIVLLDYRSPDGLADYIEANHRRDMDAGRLVYYRTDEPDRFHMAKAKNQAHRCA